jgi:hypothetical protein
MPERPKPTKQLMLDVTGGNQDLISCIHHGLYESSLRNIYPLLDFDELIAFAASSWRSRERNYSQFAGFVKDADLYNIFARVYSIGMPWVNKHKNISDKLKEKHEKVNPFSGRNLRSRLNKASLDDILLLKRSLKEPVNEYVFECQYHGAKMARGGDNHRLEIMRFQNVFPKSGKIVPAFASETAKIISAYPAEHIILPALNENPDPAGKQYDLFK